MGRRVFLLRNSSCFVVLLAVAVALALGGRLPAQAGTNPGSAFAAPMAQPNPVTEFPLPAGVTNPDYIVAGPDGNLWFSAPSEHPKVGRITPAGAITLFDAKAGDLTFGPDGNIWFTTFTPDGQGGIGRMTLDGKVTTFAGISRGCLANQITSAHDGNLYFTESNPSCNRIGEITPQGAITEFDLPDQESFPFGIVSTPDNYLAWTETSAGALLWTELPIVKPLIPKGSYVQFFKCDDPTILYVTILSNKLVWFLYTCPKQDGIFEVAVHLGGDKVYEPSPPPQGTLYHFQNGEPTSVTLGPDQNIWATEKEDKIVRITQLGEFTELPVTPGSYPYDLTSGPDGNIWFTESNGNRIGRVSVAAIPAAPTPGVPGSGSRTFPETGKTVTGKFLDYWNQHGGLAQQGYPISDPLIEPSPFDSSPYLMQYFERSVFEYHPLNNPPDDVLLSQLGTFRYKEKYPDGASGQTPNTSAGSQLFPQTGHRLGGKFLTYWNTHGGLPQQGYPISDEFQEKSDLDGKTYTVQYFERAVFELHLENQSPYDVLLSQLGTFRYKLLYPGVVMVR